MFTISKQSMACPDLYEETETCIWRCNDWYLPISEPNSFCQWGCYQFHKVANPAFGKFCKSNPNPTGDEVNNFLVKTLKDCTQGLQLDPNLEDYMKIGCYWEKRLVEANYRYPVP
jgi:hypothetical protein